MKLVLSILLFVAFASNSVAQSKSSGNSEVDFKNYLSQADIYLLKGQPDNALSAYQTCLQLNPNSAVVNYQLARIYFNFRNFDSSLSYAQLAAKLQPENYWYKNFLAKVYEAVGNYSEALKIYESCISKNPSYEDYLHLIEFYTKFEKFDDALRMLNKVEKSYGFNFDISIQKIDIYKRFNKFSEAEIEYKKIIASDSSNLFNLGMFEEFYLSISQMSKAQAILAQMKKIDDTNPLTQLAQASMCRALGQKDCFYQNLVESFKGDLITSEEKVSIISDFVFNSAIFDADKIYNLYEEILKTSENDFLVHSSFADFLMTIDSYDKAAEQLRICTELDKSDFSLWRKLFKLYTLCEDYQSLKKSVDEAEEYFPEQVEVMLYSAVASIYLNDFSTAEEKLLMSKDFGIEVTNSVNLYYFYTGVYYYMKNKKDLAFSNFEKYYNLNHDDLNVMCKYAYYLIDSNKNLQLAQNLVKQCLSFDSFNFYFYYVNAFYYYKTDDLKSAAYFAEKSNTLNKSKKFYTFELAGDIYFKNKDFPNALKNYNLALEYGGNKSSLNLKIQNCN
ncbi:MAG: tetratricopeptide repeat protein [Bacteroidales bacterium]|nr:tetratricopeptide repeat protein [Bacteroidales bacterium]